MYSVGLQASANAFLHSAPPVQLLLAALALLFVLSLLPRPHHDEDGGPAWYTTDSLRAARQFYSRRFDFLNDGFRATGQSLFRFNLFGRTIIAVSGAQGRRDFFTAKGLDLHEGFQSLSGAIPIVKGVTSDLHARTIQLIHKRLGSVQKEARLTQLIPLLLADCRTTLAAWGPAGVADPFERVYEIIFQTSVRALACEELAGDAPRVARLKRLYDLLDRGNTPAAVLLPFLPGPAALRNWWATTQIHAIIAGAIQQRVDGGVARDDTLQMMLDEGDDTAVIAGFTMGLVVASARSTGTTASWLLTYLGAHPAWRAAVQREFQTLLDAHAHDASDKPLSARLAAIPLEDWEARTPVFDRVIHETLRLAQPHVAMRRNVGPEFHIGDKAVPTGTYVVCPFSDMHLNPDIYPEPWAFDPARPDPKEPFAYAGWGVGKTICQGQRLARLELKLLAAMFVFGFDYAVVDRTGAAPRQLPRPNWNDTLTCRPPGGSCCLQYARTTTPL